MTLNEVPVGWWETAARKVPFALACVDLNDHFVYVNDAWSRLVGYSSAELRQMKWQDITKVQDVGGDAAEVSDLLEGKIEEYYLEKVYIRKGGSELPISLYVHRYPLQGPIECFLVAAQPIQDMSQLEIMQAQLSQLADRLEVFERRWRWCDKLPAWMLRWWPVVASLVAAMWMLLTWLIDLMVRLGQ